MTTAVLATSITKEKRREPLGTIRMAAHAQTARSGSGRGRPATRLSASKQGLDDITQHQHQHEGKRKANYEEDDEGFRFSRKPVKKSRPSIEPVAEEGSDVENAPPKSTPRRGRPPKKRVEDANLNGGDSATRSNGKGKSTELPRRTNKRPVQSIETDPEPEPTRSRNYESPAQTHEKKGKRGRPARSKVETQTNGFRSPEPSAGKTIPLPAADTPVIQRNKELRGAKGKGRRRSSLGMRGRRASSLIDSGASNALPHREVGTADFYKHIADEGLSEPRRMRQLLIWCATRALGDKPMGSKYSQEDQSARLAGMIFFFGEIYFNGDDTDTDMVIARVIQDELLKDFSSNADLSNWFNREDVNPPTVVVKKPNPRNVQNTEKIKELEEQIQKLQKERHALNGLLKQPPIPPLNVASESPKSSKINPKRQPKSSSSPHDQIDSSLLDPSQQAILTSLLSSAPSKNQSQPQSQSQSNNNTSPPSASTTSHHPLSPSTVSSRLSKITTKLAPTLDAFAAGIHDIELYRSSADSVSSTILRICAERLEERDALNTRQRLEIEGETEGEHDELRSGKYPERPREDLGIILGALSRVERR
ncbi:hypothetical protein N7478_001993 [Penicillium angulare]|uniref:uncharacterized protein n=1 Tax=Penicillium angulare TaxID=116970 RepID=UPI002540A1F7|nr:uncharacterized protein N7478_001993 [Penicillium angulare]KAJ5288963.1 hypothetical protein N7478_001993 [Penicillium angulare]